VTNAKLENAGKQGLPTIDLAALIAVASGTWHYDRLITETMSADASAVVFELERGRAGDRQASRLGQDDKKPRRSGS